MAVTQCVALPTTTLNPLEDPVSTVQLYKNQASKEVKLERNKVIAKEVAKKKALYWTEQLQFNDKYVEWNLQFINMMSRYASMRDGHTGRISVVSHRIYLNPTNVPPIHALPYRAGPEQYYL